MRSLTKSQFEAVIKFLKRDGQLTASGILKEAKRKASPLHSLFEWNNTSAAEKYRLAQARNVIKRANVSIVEPNEKIVHVPVRRGEGTYKEAVVVAQSVSEFELATTEAYKQLHAAQRAVDILHGVAEKEFPDSAATIGLAVQALQAATAAIEQIH